jgi:hypothetical protein
MGGDRLAVIEMRRHSSFFGHARSRDSPRREARLLEISPATAFKCGAFNS